MPRFSAGLEGPDGEMWLKIFELPPSLTQRFVVVDSSGRAVAVVETDRKITLQHVLRDFVLGVQTSEEGEPELVEYPISRSRAKSSR